MSDWDEDDPPWTSPYSTPQDYGLEIVADYEARWDDCYSFDTTVVWRDGEGKLWAGHDSGCSCYGAFDPGEFGRFPTAYTEVRTWDDVKALLPTTRERPLDSFRGKVRRALARRAMG